MGRLFVILFVCLTSCIRSGFAPMREDVELIKAKFTDSIHPGDIIIRAGTGVISSIIHMKVLDTITASHCGILVAGEGGGWNVIHSLSKSVSDYDGMQICSLDEFISDSQLSSLKITRFCNDSSGIIADIAEVYLSQKIRFNEDIDINDTTRFFCSQLPIHIIRREFGVDLVTDQQRSLKKIPKFSIFLNPAYFKRVY